MFADHTYMIHVIYIYLINIAGNTVNHQLDRLVKLKAIPAVYGHNFDKFATQNFTGDITIVPRIPLNLRFKILSHPTDEDMIQYIEIGETATWSHLTHIQDVLRIETLIDDTIQKLQKKQTMLNTRKNIILIDDEDNNHDDNTPPLNDNNNKTLKRKYDSSYYLKTSHNLY